MGCPIAILSNFASFSEFFSNKSANLFMYAARLCPAVSRHAGNAAFAASTAASTSFSLATWTLSVIWESSSGLTMVIVSPEEDGTYYGGVLSDLRGDGRR